MRHKLSLILILVAWLFATGSQLDVVQAFAWVRMFAANAQELPLGAALRRTFSPEGRCTLCVAVAQAKKQQDCDQSAAAAGKLGSKITLVFEPGAALLIALSKPAPWPGHRASMQSVGRAAPPLPPPRSAAA